MSAKKYSSDRKRSRPVTKPSAKTKIKRNKSAMFLAIFIVLMLVFSGVYAVFTFLGNNKDTVDYKDDPEYKSAIAGTNYPVAVLETSKGAIAVELYDDEAPLTCQNFIKLVKEGFYDGLVFHRVIEGFMIQGGGFTQDKNKKESASIAAFEEGVSHLEGVISMASTGAGVPGNNQFFICDVDRTDLDGGYAAFGKTIYGMDIVKSIAKVKTETKYLSTGQPMDDWPVEDVIINKIIIVKE